MLEIILFPLYIRSSKTQWLLAITEIITLDIYSNQNFKPMFFKFIQFNIVYIFPFKKLFTYLWSKVVSNQLPCRANSVQCRLTILFALDRFKISSRSSYTHGTDTAAVAVVATVFCIIKLLWHWSFWWLGEVGRGELGW